MQLLQEMGRLGERVGNAMVARADQPELLNNLHVIVLGDLLVGGPRRPTDIQALTGLTSGGVTKLLTRLESAGLILRELGAVPDDRRAVVVSLTTAGRRSAETMTDALLDDIESVREMLREMSALAESASAAAPSRRRRSA